MSNTYETAVNTPLEKVVSSKVRIAALNSLEVDNVFDLLTYYPRKAFKPVDILEDFDELLAQEDQKVRYLLPAKIVKIQSYSPRGRMRVGRLQMRIVDSNGEFGTVMYFARSMRYLRWIESRFMVQDEVAIFGRNSKSYKYDGVYFNHPQIFVTHSSDVSKMQFYSFDDCARHFRKPRVVYPANSKITTEKIATTIVNAIQRLEDLGEASAGTPFAPSTSGKLFPEILPEGTILPSGAPITTRWQALKNIHMPESLEQYHIAIEQLRLEEAFVLQTVLMLRKNDISQSRAKALVYDKRGNLPAFDKILPWKLTKSQIIAGKEISADLARPIPMQRLLQGDVGSGKTVVALRAMLQATDAKTQAVLLAPTAILAQQHYDSIRSLLGDFVLDGIRSPGSKSLRVHLLTGSTPAKARREILADIKSGEADIVIGTHALFSTAGEFRDLGLIVIDEQHRFGVEQRDKLRSQNDGEVPHMLIMTATPIPRSLAMVIFADLEISRLEEKPAQRGEIKTFSIEYSNKIWTKRMWERVREEIDKGRNVFVVAPRIGDEDPKELAPLPVDEPEELTAEDVSEEDFIDQGANSDTEVIAESAPQKIGSSTHTDIASSLFAQLTRHINLAEPLDSTSESVLHLMEALPKITALKGVDIGLLHGRMKDADKNRLMKEFLERKIQLLVSTTVIEVGIDVPNATVMVITDADKYGLATLHQLRGRIGRSELPSVCFLVTSKETAKHKITPQGKARVKTIVESGDGFDIANADIDIRGEGDIIGATQAGINSSLKLLRVRDDAEIIELANTLAGATLESDAYLDKNIGLKFAVLEELGEDEKEFLSKS